MEQRFPTFLRQCRTEHGWTQRDLAKRLGVGQQAVSSWERGATTPSAEAVDALATVLAVAPIDVTRELVPTDLSATPPRRRRTTAPRGRRPVATLPLGGLTPEEFEHFTVDVLRRDLPDAVVSRNGSSGHRQEGVDVLVDHGEGLPSGVQCKKEKDFGPTKVKRAIAELKMEVREAMLWLSRTASPQARAVITGDPLWRLEDAEDITRRVEGLASDERLFIVQKYFPELVPTWLGITAPSPWLPVEDAFDTPRSRLLTHEHAMVGREAALARVLELVSQDHAAPVLVVGQGGAGKSRFTRELAQHVTVRYLLRGQEVRPEDYELLPQGRQLVVVLDDAHDRPDQVATVVREVHRARPDARVVLATRPYGLPAVHGALRGAGLVPADITQVDLPDLTELEAERLARALLPADFHSGFVRQLAAVGRDCPLLIVLGAGLLRQGALRGTSFPGDDDLRREVLDRSTAFLIEGSRGGADSRSRWEVLTAVAALQPFPTGSPEFRSALERAAGLPYDRAARVLRDLEDSGVLLRRGRSLRVVPDLLGDVLLERACLDERTGVTTGYLDRVSDSAVGDVALHLFRNTARVDWQVGDRHSRSVPLSDPLWDAVEREFRNGGIGERLTLMGVVASVAAFQPRRALAVARIAHEDRRPDEETGLWALTYQSILDEVPAVLDGVSHHLAFLNEAVDLLADLAAADRRPSASCPRHPLRVLQQLAELSPSTPVSVQRALLHRAQAWVRDDTPAAALAFDVLEPMLATEGFELRRNGSQLALLPFEVSAPHVSDLRDSVIDLAFTELSNPDVRRAVRAVEALDAALALPRGQFGQAPASGARDAWVPQVKVVLDRLAHEVTWETLDPVIGVAVRHALDHLLRSQGALGDAARDVAAKLPNAAEHQIARALRATELEWMFIDRNEANNASEQRYHRAERALAAWRHDVVAECLRPWPAAQVLDKVVQRWEADRAAFTSGPPGAGALVIELLQQAPQLAADLLARTTAEPGSVLVAALTPTLSVLARTARPEAVARARSLVAAGSTALTREVAHALALAFPRDGQLPEEEASLLLELAEHPDELVRTSVAWAVTSIDRYDRAAALQLVSAVRFSDSLAVADRLLAALGPHVPLAWSDLTADDRQRVLDQLVQCPSIDDYSVVAALRDLSASHPFEAYSVLSRRVERSAALDDGAQYQALPVRHDLHLAFSASGAHGEVLQRAFAGIVDGIANDGVHHDLLALFTAVAEGFGAEAVAVLDDALLTARPDHLTAVAMVLTEAPRHVLWEAAPMIHRALEACRRAGPAYESEMLRCLQVRSGTTHRFGVVGRPFPQDVAEHDRSLAVAASLPYGSAARRFYERLAAAAAAEVEESDLEDRLLLDQREWV